MDLVPDMRRKNALADLPGNGIEDLSPVLSQVQAREHRQREKLYHRNQTARRKDAALIEKTITRCVSLF